MSHETPDPAPDRSEPPRAASTGLAEVRPFAVLHAEGHLIDSQLLTTIFDTVIRHRSAFEVQRFQIGRTNDEYSQLTMKVTSPDHATLRALVEELVPLGCHAAAERDAELKAADKDGCAPDEFYSTTNQRTSVRHDGRWITVERQRMDAVIVIDGDRAICRKLRELKRGDRVVCGVDGVRIAPDFRDRDRLGFAFMTNDISSERRVEVSVARIADMMRDIKAEGGRIAIVAGPVVVHTGGGEYFCELIRRGFVDVLLAGNALAVHDIEHAFYGTSLGVDLEHGVAVHEGHKHHMRAINVIIREGGIRPAVERGVLRSGIMYECVRHGVPYVLAGSIRDDGPLPDTLMDLVAAQDRYAALLADTSLVIMLSSMLHGIGVGNMLPSWVRVVCVDINPAVVTKLMDRGSSQTFGVVTDVGLFLHQLAKAAVRA
jgi:lysine-ketoglutarate reductase/saccharopine dehydrogenase-like protein (TIGR00300 family)